MTYPIHDFMTRYVGWKSKGQRENFETIVKLLTTLVKGEKILEVNSLRGTPTTFEFSRQNDMQFLGKLAFPLVKYG